MMVYPVHIIESDAELSSCPQFRIEHFQWICRKQPQTTGRVGYLPGKGFLVHMECLEADPKRTYTDPQSPVCKDSAMEAFFAFTAEQPGPDSMYLNLEINANGAMHAKYGAGRKNHQFFTAAEYEACHVSAEILPDRWHIDFLLPLTILQKLYSVDAFRKDDSFYCNFYKISESPEIEHYAAYSPIDSETPNFHVPACFGKAVLV